MAASQWSSGTFVPHIVIMNNAETKLTGLKNVDYWYAALALVLIISSRAFTGMWHADQFIVYNFLTLLMLSQAGRNITGSVQRYLKYFPLATILFFFLNPHLLVGIFLVSHLIILCLLLLRTGKRQIDIAAVPLEALIMIYFLS